MTTTLTTCATRAHTAVPTPVICHLFFSSNHTSAPLISTFDLHSSLLISSEDHTSDLQFRSDDLSSVLLSTLALICALLFFLKEPTSALHSPLALVGPLLL